MGDGDVDLVENDGFMICDRSDGECNSTAQCGDHEFDGAKSGTAVGVAPRNREGSVSHADFGLPLNKADSQRFFVHFYRLLNTTLLRSWSFFNLTAP
jgi:hypothetical protein